MPFSLSWDSLMDLLLMQSILLTLSISLSKPFAEVKISNFWKIRTSEKFIESG